MVRVDTVYQRVLALANKEQRGYITPQEFNLFAGQAQAAIFEQYFYDLNQFSRVIGNSDEYTDIADILQEKLAIFKHKTSLVAVGLAYRLPSDMYRLGTVTQGAYEAEKISYNDYLNINNSYLAKPVVARPVYTHGEGGLLGTYTSNIRIYPNTSSGVSATYIKKPKDPNWTYLVVGDKALYNASALDHQDFQLHESEEASLVLKILLLAGLQIKALEVAQIAGQEDMKNIQQEKA
tara:strand:+ start:37 stop:744 length:708 start_codon:yes stop_codon:yes gene_type:complete